MIIGTSTLLVLRHQIAYALFIALTFFALLNSAYAQSVPAGWESYSDRPDILSVAPQASNNLSGNWPDLRKAHLGAVAQILEMYPDFHIYFLARDAELLYDFAKLATQNTKRDFNRIHLLNVSRANMRHENIKSYLEQNGISKKTLEAGKKILFVDTGFAGTIPNVLNSYFPESLRKNIRTHLMASDNSSHPSTRAFLYHLNSNIAEIHPSQLHGTIVSYEHLPRYTDRSSQFELVGGQWEALSPIGKQSDGSVDKKIATQYQADLKAFWKSPDTQKTFRSKRALYRYLNRQDKRGYLQNSLTHLISAPDAQIDVIMLDLDDTLLKEVPIDFKNHPSVQSIKYEPGESVMQRYKKRLTESNADPRKVIHFEIEGSQITSYVSVRPQLADLLLQLMLKIKSKHLRLVITSANDPARTQAIFNQLRLGDHTLEEMGAELAPNDAFLDQAGNKSFLKLRQSLNLKSDNSILAIDDLPEKLIEAGTNDHVYKMAPWGASVVFNELAAPNDIEATQFRNHDQKLIANLKTLLQTSSSNYNLPINLRKAIAQDILEVKTKQFGAPQMKIVGLEISQNGSNSKSKKLELIEKYPQWTYIFENPDDEIPKLFKEQKWHTIGGLIDSELDIEMIKIIIGSLYDGPASGEKIGLQKAFILKGKQSVLEYLAQSTFSQPHTKNMTDLLRLVIEKGDQKTLQSLAIYTFAQPHTKDMTDLIRLLIEKGDDDTLQDLATYTFVQPHTKDMTDLIRLGIEKSDPSTLQYWAQYVFSQPHTKDMTDLIRLAIKKGGQSTLLKLVHYTFSQPHSKDMTDLIRLVIEKGDKSTHMSMPGDIFAKPHTKDMTDLIGLLIDRGDQDVMHCLAIYTFAQPHTKDMTDLIRLLIEKGDQGVLQSLARYAFSKPHTNTPAHKELKKFLDKKLKSSCQELLAS